jgi:hydrogenase-4 membrane subunit HyfE
MIRRIAILVLGTAVTFAVFYLPMGFLVKEAPPDVIVWAAMICILPGVVVIVAARRLRDKPPEARIIGVLATTIFRMGAALGGGIVAYDVIPTVREYVNPFVSWAVLFYVATLFIETGLLYIDSSGETKSA